MVNKMHLRLVCSNENNIPPKALAGFLQKVKFKDLKDATLLLKKQATYLTGGLVLMGCVAGAAVSYARCNTALHIPESASFAGDLDKNGILDLVVVQENNYKTPLYGVPDGDKIIYLSGEQMKIRPDNIIHYDNIEKLLNKKR